MSRSASIPATVPSSPGAATQLPNFGALRSPPHLVIPPQVGSHPGSWGSGAFPPGAPSPTDFVQSARGGHGSEWGPNYKFCHGLWPSVGNQATYYPDCYGHDEPGIDFYSSLPGSGGNVTWNVTLPTDRSPTHNQSNLYSAIWFGMTLVDPFGWLDQCFLEVQFYPDSSWYAPGIQSPAATIPGQWVGLAVAWQIEANTSIEDPCFISPLYWHGIYGPNFLNMTQGDQIGVNMTGWQGNPNGENIRITDLTNGNWSTVNLYNRTGNYANYYTTNNNYVLGKKNYPLNPAYLASDFENGLAWTPGGEYPVGFSFETGHAGNPSYPNTNPFGGCSPGNPYPVAPASTPCPSYDPGSWFNDTRTPWKIQIPTFYNSLKSEKPAQVGFAQDLGAIQFANSSSYTCTGDLGSAYCSYPWYSYACSEGAFEFGATDYPETTRDFGKYSEFPTILQYNSIALGFYPPHNVSIPTCSAPSYSVTVGGTGGGSAYFLSQNFTTQRVVSGIGAGEYGINAIPSAGKVFTSWTATGAVTVADALATWTSVTISGAGTLNASFASSGTTTKVKFDDSPATGSVEIVSNFEYTGNSVSTLTNTQQLTLNPGIYSIFALPPAGYNFSGWSSSGAAAFVAAPGFTYTWLVVDGSGGTVTVTANYVATSAMNFLIVEVVGFSGGTVSFNGGPPTTTYTIVTPSVGGYTIVATPSAGFVFAGWGYAGPVSILNFVGASSWITLEQSEAAYSAVGAFFATALTLDDAPASAGKIAIGSNLVVVPSGTTGLAFPGSYFLAAVPGSSEAFSHWSVSNPNALWVETGSLAAVGTLIVNATGTITANYVGASTKTLWYNDTPTLGGQVVFNFIRYSNMQTNNSVTAGEYLILAAPAPGYSFVSWSSTGSVSVITSVGAPIALVTVGAGTLGSITATYQPIFFNVTYVGAGTANLDGVALFSDEQTNLPLGNYILSLSLPGGASFLRWETSGGLSVTSPTSQSTTLVVSGPGTVYAIETAPPLMVGVPSAAPSAIDIGVTTLFSVTAGGASPLSYQWVGLPAGCLSSDSPTTSCVPSIGGKFLIQVVVTDAFTDAIESQGVVLTVGPRIVASWQLSLSTITLGLSTQTTVSPSGGTPPYNFVYTGLSGCGAPTPSGSVTCTPTVTGSFTLTLNVSDLAGGFYVSGLAVIVLPRPAFVSPNVNPTQVTVGSVFYVWANVSGGTLPLAYTYSGLPLGCMSANQAEIGCLPTQTGTFRITIQAKDANGVSAFTNVSANVNPAPEITAFTATPESASLGNPIHWTVLETGGTAPLSYAYSGLPAGCNGPNSATWNCTPTVTGTFTVVVVVTDADGHTASGTSPLSISPGSSPFSVSGGTLYLLLALIVAAVVIVVVLLLRRKAPPSEPAVAPPPATPPPGASAGGADYIYGSDQPWAEGPPPPQG